MKQLLLALATALVLSMVGCSAADPAEPIPQFKEVTRIGIPINPPSAANAILFDDRDTLLIGTHYSVFTYDWTAERWTKQTDLEVAAGNAVYTTILTKDVAGNVFLAYGEKTPATAELVGSNFKVRKKGSTSFETLPSIKGLGVTRIAADKQGTLYAITGFNGYEVYVDVLRMGASSWQKVKVPTSAVATVGDLFADFSGSNVYYYNYIYDVHGIAAGANAFSKIYDFNAEGLGVGTILSDANDKLILNSGMQLYRLDPTTKTYSKLADRPAPGDTQLGAVYTDKAGNLYTSLYLGNRVLPPTWDIYKMSAGTTSWQSNKLTTMKGVSTKYFVDGAGSVYVTSEIGLGTIGWRIAKMIK